MPDVLIHSMELPKKDELLSINIWPNGSVTIAMDLECKPVARAVELPPHGDLIEMDKLYKTMETYTDYGGATEPHDENQIHRDSILFAIENAPVVVPAERRESSE